MDFGKKYGTSWVAQVTTIVTLSLLSSLTLAQVRDGMKAVEWNSGEESLSYPESAVVDAAREESMSKAQTEAMEREVRRQREAFEIRRSEAEREISDRKRKIEDYKYKQDQMSAILNGLKTEMAEVESKHKTIEKEILVLESQAKSEESESSAEKFQLDQMKAQLQSALEGFEKKKQETFRRIDSAQAQMQKWNSEVSKAQSAIVNADNSRSEYEKVISKLQVQMNDAKSKRDEVEQDRQLAEQATKQTKDSLDKAQKDYQGLLVSLKNTEKDRDRAQQEMLKTRGIYTTEMKRIEDKTAQAQMLKALAENEKVRSASESDRMKETLEKARSIQEQMNLELAQSQTSLMQSKISLGQIRNDLVLQIASPDKASANTGSRNLASLESPTGSTKVWTSVKECNRYADAAGGARPVGKVSPDEKLMAIKAKNGFVKAVDNSGATFYVKSTCGNFD